MSVVVLTAALCLLVSVMDWHQMFAWNGRLRAYVDAYRTSCQVRVSEETGETAEAALFSGIVVDAELELVCGRQDIIDPTSAEYLEELVLVVEDEDGRCLVVRTRLPLIDIDDQNFETDDLVSEFLPIFHSSHHRPVICLKVGPCVALPLSIRTLAHTSSKIDRKATAVIFAEPKTDFAHVTASTDVYLPEMDLWIGPYPFLDRTRFRRFLGEPARTRPLRRPPKR